MINKNFNDLDKAKRYVDVFLKVAMTLCIIMSALMIIGGIILCVYDGITGVVYIISGAIVCGYGIFMAFLAHSLLTVFVDGMCDVKYSGIIVESLASSNSSSNVATPVAKSYESCTSYYLYYTDKNAFLSANSMDGQGLRVVKDILSSLKFQSEEEAMRFAEYKRLEIGEKWQIVKKDLIIPID